jgi:hypothetical protein
MPRQNFITSDFFLQANTARLTEVLSKMEANIASIRFIEENRLTHSLRYMIGHPDTAGHFVDVSMLPLDEKFTRVCLHASEISGQSFTSNPPLQATLKWFRDAFEAGIENRFLQPEEKKQQPKRSVALELIPSLVAGITGIFLRGKLS